MKNAAERLEAVTSPCRLERNTMLTRFTHDGVVCALGRARLLSTKIKVYLYYVDGLLVDTGPESMATEIVPFYESLRIRQATLTHLHEDHCGMAAWLQERWNIPVYCHPELVDEAAQDARLPLYRRLIWKGAGHFTPRPFRVCSKHRSTPFAWSRHRAIRATISSSTKRRWAGSSWGTSFSRPNRS